jgi:citrate synthase
MMLINMKQTWITAEEALARLKTKPQTLYANVSRGRIRSKPDPADSRRSLYLLADVERMAERHTGPKASAEVAAEAIHWGEPVMPTSISAISDGELFYRGRSAIDLSAKLTLESVASLLWDCETVSIGGSSVDAGAEGGRLARAFRLLADRVVTDLPAMGRSTAALKTEAADVLSTMASALAPSAETLPLHERLATGWRRPEASEPIRIVLVLAAEHELNVSAFAARVTASSGAALSAAVLSGLASLTGPRHGGAWLSVNRLVERAGQVGVREAIRDVLSAEGAVRPFGHPLYPDGDPRAKAILASFEVLPLHAELASAGEELLGEPANLDFALAALAARFELPQEAPLAMFALARTAGWLAHAMEQVASGEMIRPRARYGEPRETPGDQPSSVAPPRRAR